MKYKRQIGLLALGIVLVGLGVCGGYWYANRPMSVENELDRVRNRLNTKQALCETQSDMTMLSRLLVTLAELELDYTRYTICNQTMKSGDSTAFENDCETWDKYYAAENAKQLLHEGGSISTAEYNLRACNLLEKRIAEINNKWRKQ